MDRDRRTRTGARAPGVDRQKPFELRCYGAPRPPAQNGDQTREAGSTKDEGKLIDAKAASPGKASSDQPALKPYWENPQYGILGRAMETSASCESRHAPLLYPTCKTMR